MTSILQSHSEVETIQIACDLGRRLSSNGVVLLFGELGTGKTAFVRGLVAAAGGEPNAVTSPSFTLIQEYVGHQLVHHVDLYRLQQEVEVDDLGLDELIGASGLIAIEWADRLPRPIPGSVQVFIKDKGGDDREIRIIHSDSSELPS